jgi:hypothetical protein
MQKMDARGIPIRNHASMENPFFDLDSLDPSERFRWLWPPAPEPLVSDEGLWEETALLGWPGNQWYAYADSYREAAQALYDRALESNLNPGILFIPFAHVWRHHFELLLKHLLIESHALLALAEEPKIKSHKITTIWNNLAPLLQSICTGESQETFDTVGLIVRQLGELDPNSESFRYPVNNSGDPTLPGLDKVDVARFHRVLSITSNWLLAACEAISHQADIASEIAGDVDYY